MALAVCVQLSSRLRILILICCTKKDLLTLGGAVLSLWSAWTSTDPQFNILNNNEVVIIYKLTAQHLLTACVLRRTTPSSNLPGFCIPMGEKEEATTPLTLSATTGVVVATTTPSAAERQLVCLIYILDCRSCVTLKATFLCISR